MVTALLVFSVSVVLAMAFVGLTEAHYGVNRRFMELDTNQAGAALDELPARMTETNASAYTDQLPELSFTRSLLALSKARSQGFCDFPTPSPAGSSSLVLAHRVQSKNPDQLI